MTPTKYHFDGNGVWENYFEPVSDFTPGDPSCQDKPLVTMDLYHITPGIHGFAEWAPRCWRYQYVPDYMTKPHIPLQEWLQPQRKVANRVLTKYIKFLPHIKDRAESVNPDCSLEENACLGMHIRHSDKAAGRRVVQTDEFLPFADAFAKAGGRWIYLATDSANVVEHIRQNWPANIQKMIRSMGDNVVRSKDEKAVFDIGSHDTTNTEILVEILALSKCQFLIHGLSAVSESSIWINVDLHYTSVNLEDSDHLDPSRFGSLVEKVLSGGNASDIVLQQQRKSHWWKNKSSLVKTKVSPTNEACRGFDGVFHIAQTGRHDGAGTAFFTSVVNQIIYAERHNLKPWIHLGKESEIIYDDDVHSTGPDVSLSGMVHHDVEHVPAPYNQSIFSPGQPVSSTLPLEKTVKGNGIWETYFSPLSDFVPGDASCTGRPLVSMDAQMVTLALNSWSPWSVKTWRYDNVPNDLWNPNNLTLKTWLEPMRIKANKVVKKYFQFHPYLQERANEVNPVDEDNVCLALHLRNSDKGNEKYRTKFPPNKFKSYLQAFVRAGGKHIYIASDSHRVLEYIRLHFPPEVNQIIRTQGPYVVRSTKKWSIPMLEKHHRSNSEALVDILAMSKCSLLLHGNSAVSEAAIYLNLNLHNQSVNWEDDDRMSVDDFEALSRRILEAKKSSKPKLSSPTIVKGDDNRKCRRNAIVYLAQKQHSSYRGRNSYDMLLKSLNYVNKNYLSLGNHANNTDVFIFHTADFGKQDLDEFESRVGTDFRKLVHLVDLQDTTYWKLPPWHENDNKTNWYAFDRFSEGYRRMMHFYAIDIWDFFLDHGKETQCNYEYIMRFDEDSVLHSPIQYDIFDFMKDRKYEYGFRLCAFELAVTQRARAMWKQRWTHKRGPKPLRDDPDMNEMCGVYNNFFIAKLSFFQSAKVKRFTHFIDRGGFIYRRHLGDLMIHSMAIYFYLPSERIHRFLDFTYEHGTVDPTSGCVIWGGIQAGFNDPNALATLDTFYQEKVVNVLNCSANDYMMPMEDLSPTYSHLSMQDAKKFPLRTVMVGKVELPGKGNYSG